MWKFQQFLLYIYIWNGIYATTRQHDNYPLVVCSFSGENTNDILLEGVMEMIHQCYRYAPLCEVVETV